ncbi:BON domain-containing protein [uncultured Nitrospira sp.]|uniref:BON domain-containing protein n=1 Tax=uncultured Nitrospira sp. TaxID=157176 RepID=UPI0031409B72
MHEPSRKVITIGPAVIILCLGLPFVSQAGSSYDSTDYRTRYDTPQRESADYRNRYNTPRRESADSRSGKNDVPIDRYSDDRSYYTDQYGDRDTMRTQENLKRNRSDDNWIDDGVDGRRAGMSDRELEKAVRDELSWSPFVDEDPIRVNVRQGVVTLQGTVEDPSEMAAAVDNAYEAGARRVVSRLRIQN